MTRRKPNRPRVAARSGALLCLSLLLLGSGALRLTGGAGMAIAREIGDLGGDLPGAGAEADGCTTGEDAALILAALDERKRKLDDREAALDARRADLDLAEAEIESNLAALVEAERQLARTMALAETAAEEDLGKLTSVYESMKPKDAAALFAQMDPQFAAGFLGRMRAEAAAKVMAGLPAEAAYSISVVLAGRNAGAPTE